MLLNLNLKKEHNQLVMSSLLACMYVILVTNSGTLASAVNIQYITVIVAINNAYMLFGDFCFLNLKNV